MANSYQIITKQGSSDRPCSVVGCLVCMLMAAAFLIAAPLPAPAQEKGQASFYSNRLHGRRMSDGTAYHRDSMTCAHKRYPLGTMLKVTNVNNGKSVVVRVADRGPHARGRIIDLSYAAAKEIGMIAAGVAMVRVEPFRGDITVPLKDDSRYELPELDFELSRDAIEYVPQWQQHDEPPRLKQERTELLKDEQRIEQVKKEMQPATTPAAKNKKAAATEQPPVSRSNPHKASQRH